MSLNLWILISLCAGFSRAFLLASQKELIKSKYSSLQVSFGSILFAFPLIFIVFVSQSGGFPSNIQPITIIAIGVSGVCNITGFLAYLKALKIEDLSIVAPLASFTPIFVAFGEPLLRGVTLTIPTLTGAIITVIGSLLIVSDNPKDIPQILKRLKETGPIFAVGSAFIYASASIADKTATSMANPYFVMFGVSLIMLIGFGCIILLQNRQKEVKMSSVLRKEFIPVGIFQAGLSILIFPAFSLAPTASHVIIIIQVSLIIDVIIGWVVFNETDIFKRFIGGAIIFCGIGVATLF